MARELSEGYKPYSISIGGFTSVQYIVHNIEQYIVDNCQQLCTIYYCV